MFIGKGGPIKQKIFFVVIKGLKLLGLFVKVWSECRKKIGNGLTVFVGPFIRKNVGLEALYVGLNCLCAFRRSPRHLGFWKPLIQKRSTHILILNLGRNNSNKIALDIVPIVWSLPKLFGSQTKTRLRRAKTRSSKHGSFCFIIEMANFKWPEFYLKDILVKEQTNGTKPNCRNRMCVVQSRSFESPNAR